MSTDILRDKLIVSRISQKFQSVPMAKKEDEGGCGVIGLCSSIPISGKHIFSGLNSMKNRGNGKGGGIAAVGLDPEFFNTTADILKNCYCITIAYLDLSIREKLESEFIERPFIVDHVSEIQPIKDASLLNLSATPPTVVCYFIRVKTEVRKAFMTKYHIEDSLLKEADDEIVYSNTYQLNSRFYSSLGEKRALVFSHGKNMIVCKLVGFGDDVIRYYQLENLGAHIWIGHHRYPTRGKVIHPGGAHPFVGMNEALVHNGDFANYSSLCSYLSQVHIYPLFLTDTEVAALTFDMYYRIEKYPLEYVIEAFAPTTERDLALLDASKQEIYKDIETTHIHGSPDGPWFFLIAQSDHHKNVYRLIGITDTSMLRPQVFALQSGTQTIGFSSSEKQVIDATLQSIADESPHFWQRADMYWSARGGSHTDGGAFIFTITPQQNNKASMVCTNKFGGPIISQLPRPTPDYGPKGIIYSDFICDPHILPQKRFQHITKHISLWETRHINSFLKSIEDHLIDDASLEYALKLLTLFYTQPYPTLRLKKSQILSYVDSTLQRAIDHVSTDSFGKFVKITSPDNNLPKPENSHQVAIIDARCFSSEGKDSLAHAIKGLYKNGFYKLIVVNTRGQRFIGTGLGKGTHNVEIDVYGSPGDYLGSGLSGALIRVYNSCQDQVGNIMEDGTLVIYGDVGQTYMYSAKGGEAYVLGNAQGRPYINAAGHPRGIINGTCLDYCAESFMAGDSLDGGGFIVILGLYINADGKVCDMDTPYPGGNLFSLAPGGAIYIRDPHNTLSENQLNGGTFNDLTPDDWNILKPYLKKNEQFIGISIERVLTVDGNVKLYKNVFRKIMPTKIKSLTPEQSWVKKH